MTIISVLLVVSIVLFWIDWFIIQYAWLNLYDGVFRIADNLLLPILLMVAVFSVLFTRAILKKSKIKNKQSPLKTISFLVILILVLGIHTVTAASLINTGEYNFALTNIVSKEIDNEPYLYIENIGTNNLIKLKCSNNIYTSVIVDENVLYLIEYRTDLFNSKSGVISHLDSENYIDKM